jgi:hypothetical protein
MFCTVRPLTSSSCTCLKDSTHQPCRTSLRCRYCMQRPWAELRPIQVIMQKASGALALQWPPGTPTLYQHLAEVGQQLTAVS